MILVDAGPLVALVDRSDQHHSRCVEVLRSIREPMATLWPPLTEAMYLLGDLPAAQEAVWETIERGTIQLMALTCADIPRIRQLMVKYADRPMDLADAALVAVAEREGTRTVFTVDAEDFAIYRLHGRSRFIVLPG